MGQKIDLQSVIYGRFGRLEVIGIGSQKIRKGGQKMPVLLCLCDCGNPAEIDLYSLRKGNTISCGCFQKEAAKRNLIIAVEAVKLPDGLAVMRKLFRTYKNNARIYNRSFTITLEQFKEIAQRNCYYCGISPSPITHIDADTPFIGNGIDRKDNNRGYDYKNCLSCCTMCNRAKSDHTYEKFMGWIDRITKYRTTFIESSL